MCAVDADNTEGRGDGAGAGVAAVGSGCARTAEGTDSSDECGVPCRCCDLCHSSLVCLSIDTVMLIVPTWLVGNQVLCVSYNCTDALTVYGCAPR